MTGTEIAFLCAGVYAVCGIFASVASMNETYKTSEPREVDWADATLCFIFWPIVIAVPAGKVLTWLCVPQARRDARARKKALLHANQPNPSPLNEGLYQ